MLDRVPIVHRVIAIPELAENLFQYLWSSQISRLRLVSKAFHSACVPFFCVALTETDLVDNLRALDLVENLKSCHLITSYTSYAQDLALLDKIVSSCPCLEKLQLNPIWEPESTAGYRARAIGTDEDEDEEGDQPRRWCSLDAHRLPRMDLSWLTIHDSLPCMQSITMDALNLTMDLDHFMTTIAVHTPSLESILVENGMSLGFKAFVQSLDAWSHLSTCSLRLDILDTAKDDNFEAMEDISRAWRERGESKQYPRVHTFELMHVDIEYEARRLLARMFSNARTLTLYPPSSLWYETIEQDMAKDQSQTLFPEGKALDEACMSLEKENLSRPFPSLICLKTSDVLEEHLNALPWILGHQSDQGNGKKTNTSHRLQGLELIDWEIRDYDLEQLSTTLDDYSVTLRRLSFKQWGRFDIDLADFFTKRCCRELTDLRFFGDETFTGAITRFLRKMLYVPQQLMEEHEGMLWDDMLDTPRPVMLVGTFQTTTAASEPVPAPLFYSVSWRKTLTTLHLGYMDIRQDDMHNVNKLLKLLPKLVEFLLDCMLMDMGLFDGLGREVELGQCQGQLGEKGGMLPSRMDFEHERPFLERMSLRLDGSFIYTEDECKALLWTKFRFLEGLAVQKWSLSKCDDFSFSPLPFEHAMVRE
ncbi:hypothetical protein EDD21DRAFT_118173 [Dissophora ornata]|nr:hypothetical protein EDD21DRAFT_118173 [Dissophora ornata]